VKPDGKGPGQRLPGPSEDTPPPQCGSAVIVTEDRDDNPAAAKLRRLHWSGYLTRAELADALELPPPARGTRGLADALDHLDHLGLCACWTAPRHHRTAA
jgi:hypothetical protein